MLVNENAGKIVKEAWYFNEQLPLAGHGHLRAGHRPVVLVYRPVHRAAGPGRPNQQIARRGSIFAAFLKLFPVYLFIIPGLICFALAKSGKVPGLEHILGARRKAHQPARCQRAFPLMVDCMLPPGLRGIVVAGLLSALMGSLAGVFNACSTLFTVDLYQKWKPKASQHQLVRTGRIATAIMVLIALAWIPVVQNASSLYEYLQKVQGYLAPPIFVVFFFGVFFKRLERQGVPCGHGGRLLAGDLPHGGGDAGDFRAEVVPRLGPELLCPGLLPLDRQQDQFSVLQHLITLVSAVVMVAVSYLTKRPDYAKIRRPDLRHGDGRGPRQDPRKLGLARGGRLAGHPGLHRRGVRLLYRVGYALA